ncbi:hypothetical protein HNQ56_001440 [Anaerotaenia torta]|uniref:glycoside hydrolase family 127 protein n=1 Tax=Anaerotaenia torta TaxID=433293 RepID=UPI003D19ED44
MNREVDIKNIKIRDEFWSSRQKLVKEVVIPYQEKILNDEIPGVEKSHALANFRIAAGLEEGEFYGMVFQDSDVAKWLEGVAYSLAVSPDPELEARADAVIDVIEQAQQADGYLNTYFTIKEPEHRWQNLHECHELYCAGHMMEAAAAYCEATGKDKLLKVMERMADHIDGLFGPGKRTGIPGHQEIEIGLMRLYHITGKEKYRNLAQYFIDERGKNPDFFKEEAKERGGWTHFGLNPADTKYNQSFAPVREQKTAEGHSVRAVYMYTAMADLAGRTGDRELFNACDALWDNITGKRMYLTGGIGSTVEGEAFSIDYDLPNDSIYGETCASIGLVFFAKKMLDIKPDNKYADVMERALYNGIISGMQLDGKRFFYVNPLEVNPGVSGILHGYKHVLPERPGWYACACCPPNVVRLLMSLGKYAWSEAEDTIYSHLFVGGEADLKQASIKVESKYPWEGKVAYTVKPKAGMEEFTLVIRIPSYVGKKSVKLGREELRQGVLYDGISEENGYLYLKRNWKAGDRVEIIFDMPVRRVRCNTKVRSNTGHVALMRGPLVYCFEGADHDGDIQELWIPEEAGITAKPGEKEPFAGMVTLELTGIRLTSHDVLYTEENPQARNEAMKAIPYFAWGNRGLNQMRVWMPELKKLY